MDTTWIATRGTDGFMRVRIDRPDQSVNTFSHAVLRQLDQLLDRIEGDPSIRGVMFRSAKPGVFFAGADIEEMKQIAGPQAAREFSEAGQRIFGRLSRLATPTVALISGSCLGGGLEFALACRFRVADEQRKTLLGLPEVKLGLVPGWGGTVRLPRQVGIAAALRIITGGEMINPRQAKSMGLIDDVVPTEVLDIAGERYLTDPPRQHRRRTLQSRLLETRVGHTLALRQARRLVQSKSHGHYPAPARAIEVIGAGLRNVVAGYAAESAAIAELAAHPVTVECIRLFYLREYSKHWAESAIPAAAASTIGAVGVIGAGAMGAGIARVFADRGIPVRLKDTSHDFVARGLRAARSLWDDDVRKKRATAKHANDAFARISPTTEYSGFQHADLVIEAVVEDMSVKHAVLGALEKACGPQTVIATNTSSLSLTEIARASASPERVVGLHFFNPPHQMPLVEIIRTEQTSPKALRTALAAVQLLGKTPIVVRDCAGFLVNRLLMPYLNEVGYLMVEAADPMELERAAVAFGFPMGPFELTDLVGADVSAKVAQHLHAAYGDRMAPAPAWLRIQELKNQLGSKTSPKLLKRGWFGRKLHPLVRRALRQLRRDEIRAGRVSRKPPDRDELARRMVYPVINEAARCLDEGVVTQPDAIDLAMVFGTGFAPFRGGPLRYADSIGVGPIVEALDRLAVVHRRLAPCDALRRMAQRGERFAVDPVRPLMAAAG